MPNNPPSNHGKFVWYDVMTSDVKAAQAFYQSVFGWQMKDTEMNYVIASAGSAMVAGIMPPPDEARKGGTPSCWTGYIAVGDVDDYAQRIQSAGGKVHRPPCDIPNVGRFAVVADPHGAVFILFNNGGQNPQTDPTHRGNVCWRELHAGNVEEDFAFYAKLFGWTKMHAMDLGPPLGEYQIFAIDGQPAGGMFNKSPDMPGPLWLYYFQVDSMRAAVDRVTNGGGKLLSQPHQIPDGNWIVHCLDPQGAFFAMLATKE